MQQDELGQKVKRLNDALTPEVIAALPIRDAQDGAQRKNILLALTQELGRRLNPQNSTNALRYAKAPGSEINPYFGSPPSPSSQQQSTLACLALEVLIEVQRYRNDTPLHCQAALLTLSNTLEKNFIPQHFPKNPQKNDVNTVSGLGGSLPADPVRTYDSTSSVAHLAEILVHYLQPPKIDGKRIGEVNPKILTNKELCQALHALAFQLNPGKSKAERFIQAPGSEASSTFIPPALPDGKVAAVCQLMQLLKTEPVPSDAADHLRILSQQLEEKVLPCIFPKQGTQTNNASLPYNKPDNHLKRG